MERFVCNKTENALIAAFFRLLNLRHYRKITIREICEEAHVERSTFYRYFNCKEDFLEFVARTAIQTDLLEYQKGEPGSAENLNLLFDRIIYNISRYLATSEREKRVKKRTQSTTDMPKIVNQQIANSMEVYLQQASGGNLPVSPTLLARFVSAGVLELMLYRFSATGEEQTKREAQVEQFLQALSRALSYRGDQADE